MDLGVRCDAMLFLIGLLTVLAALGFLLEYLSKVRALVRDARAAARAEALS